MLQFISWGDFFNLVLISIIIYYAFISFIYYKREVKNSFKNGFKWRPDYKKGDEKKSIQNSSEMNELSEEGNEGLQTEYGDPRSINGFENDLDYQPRESDIFQNSTSDKSRLFPIVHDLMDEIGQVLKTAANKQFIKEELITALQIKLAKYPMLENTDFKNSVNNFIATESRKACAVFLSEDELKRLWRKGK